MFKKLNLPQLREPEKDDDKNDEAPQLSRD